MKIDNIEFLNMRTKEAHDRVMDLNWEYAEDFAKNVFALRNTNSKVIFMGNGASYTIANHAALDYMSQTGVQTICAADQAVLTAFANDFGYDNALERFCKINYKLGDILVCVSSSGNSPNVVNAAKYVKSVGGNVFSFTGFNKENELSKIVNVHKNFWVDSKVYNVVESIHNLWLAMICDLMIEWMGDGAGLHGIEI
jgi:D-sedoheptulose 7-phosphate isomerase